MVLATVGSPRIKTLEDFERLLYHKRTAHKPQSADRQLVRAWSYFCDQDHVVNRAGAELSRYSTVYAANLLSLEEADAKTVDFMHWVDASIGTLSVARSGGARLLLDRPAQYHRDWFKNLEDVRRQEFAGWSRKLTDTHTPTKNDINKRARKRAAEHQEKAKVKKQFSPGDKGLKPEEVKAIFLLASRSPLIKELWTAAALAYELYTGRRAVETFTLQLDRVHAMDNTQYRPGLNELKVKPRPRPALVCSACRRSDT